MNKEQWLRYNDKILNGSDRSALKDYFFNRHDEIMKKLGKLLVSDNIDPALDYLNDLVSRLSSYEVFLLRLNKIEALKMSSSDLSMRIATDKDIQSLIKYDIKNMLINSKAFDKYKHDPNGLDKN